MPPSDEFFALFFSIRVTTLLREMEGRLRPGFFRQGAIMNLKNRALARALGTLLVAAVVCEPVMVFADAPSSAVQRAERAKKARAAREARARRNIARRPSVRRQAVRRARVAPTSQQPAYSAPAQPTVAQAPWTPPPAPPPAPVPPAAPAALPQLSVAKGGSGWLYGLLGAAALGGAIAAASSGGSSSP